MTLYYTAGANNLIQIEIALKIAKKIYVNERFPAYIVVPTWPEGNPTATPDTENSLLAG
jgi:phospholipase D1/2